MNTCRFCLKDSENIQFQLLSTINSAYIKLILPEIDINLTETPTICSMCLNSLEDAYNFKSRCLKLEEKLKNIRNTTIIGEVEMNIESKNDTEDVNCDEISSELKQQIENDNVKVKVELDYETFPEMTQYCFTSENQIKNIAIKHEIDISENEINCCSFEYEEKFNEKSFKCNDLPYICNICSLRFTCKSSLKTHALCHAEEIYTCENCQKQFDNPRSLRCHMFVHSRKECEICKRTFRNLYNLNQHMKLHNNKSVIPFQCNSCGRCYDKQTRLEAHTLYFCNHVILD